jgi:hypothetical protein
MYNMLMDERKRVQGMWMAVKLQSYSVGAIAELPTHFPNPDPNPNHCLLQPSLAKPSP